MLMLVCLLCRVCVCVCVCDSNGAKAQSHSPSSQVGKQLSGLWLLAEQTSLFLMLCFLKVQGYQPTSHLCTVYLSICSLVDGPGFFFFLSRVAGITCAFLAVLKSFYFIIYFVTKTDFFFLFSFFYADILFTVVEDPILKKFLSLCF